MSLTPVEAALPSLPHVLPMVRRPGGWDGSRAPGVISLALPEVHASCLTSLFYLTCTSGVVSQGYEVLFSVT